MPKSIQIPAQLIDRATATNHNDADQCAALWARCPAHPVAECTTCGNVWRLDQLRHQSIGYYPGDPALGTLFADRNRADPKPRDLKHGNYYAHHCPVCDNDLTQLVIAHYDAHELPASRLPNPLPPSTD
jgi:hypothetical protein